MNIARVRNRTYRIFYDTEARGSAAVATIIGALIIANVIGLMIETVPDISVTTRTWLGWLESISIAAFSLEYVLRCWSITADERYAHPVFGRLRFMLSPMALIDLAVILPSLVAIPFIDLRSLRLIRLLRLFRIRRYSKAMTTLWLVVRAKRGELSIVGVLVGMMLVIVATLIYYAEKDAKAGQFLSIPDSLWWTIVTLTTIGYGDVVPMTTAGRIIGGCAALMGVGIITLPAGILATGFIERIKHHRQCPHCGHELE
jgi:voltage-gated potassium channel